jgi:hypothetical protein
VNFIKDILAQILAWIPKGSGFAQSPLPVAKARRSHEIIPDPLKGNFIVFLPNLDNLPDPVLIQIDVNSLGKLAESLSISKQIDESISLAFLFRDFTGG